MRNAGWIALVCAAIALTVVFAGTSYTSPVAADPPNGVNGTVNWDVDPDTTGNDAQTLGTIENCVAITVGGGSMGDAVADHYIDVVVYGDTEAPIAYDASLTWDNAIVRVVNPVGHLVKFPVRDYATANARPDAVSPWYAGAACLQEECTAGTPDDGVMMHVALDVLGSGVVNFGFTAPLTAYKSVESGDGLHPQTLGTGTLAINTSCPGDLDSDDVLDESDNCPLVYNPGQADSDGDGIGDACEAVGGIAVFPDISSSTGQNYAIAAMLAFVAVVAFAAGGWYAKRRLS